MWVKQGNIFNEHHSQHPVVDVYSDTFKIYYSTRDNKGRSIPMSISVFKNNPTEYLHPTPLNLELGQPGSFDWSGIMPTNIVTLKDGTPFTKSQMVDAMEAAKIQTRSYFTGNALFHPAYEELATEYENPREQFPIATKSTLDTFFLGVYPGITEEQLDYIEVTIDEFIKNVR